MTTLTRLDAAQQRLVNTVFDAPYPQCRVDQLLPAVHADWDNVIALVDAQMIEARNQQNGCLGLATLTGLRDRTAGSGPHVWPLWLHLIDAGRRWVLTDPTNRLLRAVDNGPRQQRRLDYAVRIAGGQQTVLDAITDGYLTLHEIESQREVPLTDRSIREFVFEGSRHFTVNATRKIRQVLG